MGRRWLRELGDVVTELQQVWDLQLGGAEKAAWLAALIVATWEQLQRPCPRAVIDRADALCDEPAAAFDWERAVLVHATLGVPMRECDVDAEAVWQWGYIERVSTGLLNLRAFAGRSDSTSFLEVAARSQ